MSQPRLPVQLSQLARSDRFQNAHLNQSSKVPRDLRGQLPALHKHAQFHVERHGEFRQVGAGDEERAAVSHGDLSVQ